MSLDLTLLVPDLRFEPNNYAHTIIEFGTNLSQFSDFSQYADQIGTPVKPEFCSFLSRIPDGKMKGESCYGLVTKDPYGNGLLMIPASAIVEFWSKFDDLSIRQMAALAFLKVIGDKPVALYWH